MLEQLLNYVIAKNISHKLKRVGLNLSKNLIFLVTVCRFKFLLNETRAMLVAAEFDDVVVYILGMSVHEQ